MLEGSRSGSGSIPLTNGSGSGSRRPKHTWIRGIWIRNRIRIWIRNTAVMCMLRIIFRFLTNLSVITKPRNYGVITRFRNYVTTLCVRYKRSRDGRGGKHSRNRWCSTTGPPQTLRRQAQRLSRFGGRAVRSGRPDAEAVDVVVGGVVGGRLKVTWRYHRWAEQSL